MVKDNLQEIFSHIHEVCSRVGRDSKEVTLVGVTKFADVPAINEAIACGLMHIAENRVQLAEAKFPQIEFGGRPVMRHLIGHLQTNKAKDAVKLFDLIQSVDSIKLADEINKRAAAVGKVQDILIQVDIAREEQKFGLPEEELEAMLTHVSGLANIRLLGLMTMAPLTDDKGRIRAVFRQGRALFDRAESRSVVRDRVQMRYLSMGMSSDYQIALEEGANMVRVGSAIFQ